MRQSYDRLLPVTGSEGGLMSYRVLVAAKDPDRLTVLLAVAVPLARARGGKVVVLYAASSGGRPPWLAVPTELSDVVEEPLVVRAADVSGAVLSVIRDEKPDLLLLHWRGQPSRGRYLLGRTLDRLIQLAPCDVAVVRAGEPPSDFESRMRHLQRAVANLGSSCPWTYL